MTSSGVFSKLAFILIINLFIQMHTVDAKSVVCGTTVKDQVQNVLSTVCNTTDSELICDKTVGFFLTKIEKDCTDISNQFCASSMNHIFQQKIDKCGPLGNFNVFEQFLLTYSAVFDKTCHKTKTNICSLFDNKNLKKMCTKNLAYFEEMSAPETRNGNETTLCYVLPNTIRDVCELAVEQGCEAIKMEQPELRYLVPECKNHLSKLVCEDVLYTIEKIVEEKQNGIVHNTTESLRQDPADCLYEDRVTAPVPEHHPLSAHLYFNLN